MTEEEADRRAKQLNTECGERGASDFYVPVQLEDGDWEVRREKERKRTRFFGKLFETWLES